MPISFTTLYFIYGLSNNSIVSTLKYNIFEDQNVLLPVDYSIT